MIANASSRLVCLFIFRPFGDTMGWWDDVCIVILAAEFLWRARYERSARCRPDFVAAAGSCPSLHGSLTWLDDRSPSPCPRLCWCQFRLLHLREPPRSHYDTAPPPHPDQPLSQPHHAPVSLYVLRLPPLPSRCLHINGPDLLTRASLSCLFVSWTHRPNSRMHLPRLSRNNRPSVLHCWYRYNTQLLRWFATLYDSTAWWRIGIARSACSILARAYASFALEFFLLSCCYCFKLPPIHLSSFGTAFPRYRV